LSESLYSAPHARFSFWRSGAAHQFLIMTLGNDSGENLDHRATALLIQSVIDEYNELNKRG
jgi:hypothetical protein